MKPGFMAPTIFRTRRRVFVSSVSTVASLLLTALYFAPEHLGLGAPSVSPSSDVGVDYGTDLPWDTQPREIPLYDKNYHPKGLTVFDEPRDNFRGGSMFPELIEDWL